MIFRILAITLMAAVAHTTTASSSSRLSACRAAADATPAACSVRCDEANVLAQANNKADYDVGTVLGPVLDRILHSRMPLVPMLGRACFYCSLSASMHVIQWQTRPS
jgi:hypothetical protein